MAQHMMDRPVNLDDLMDFGVDSDMNMVDPALSMPAFENFSGKTAEPFNLDPATWQNQFDGLAPQDLQAANHDQDFVESITTASSPGDADKGARTRSKASRTSSKSSVPSLSSGVSSPGAANQTRGKATKTRAKKGSGKQTKEASQAHQENDASTAAKEAKPPRKKQKTTKKAAAASAANASGEEDDSKRNKYLERNRIAASKCRQKKKVWVSDLEAQKSEMEAKHAKLQSECAQLLDQVTELKTELMEHANCCDPNIDSWIEVEAKRFVQRTADRQPAEEASRRLSSSASAGRRPSLSESFFPHSRASSTSQFAMSPMIKHEEINYDHMPDDMFF